MLNIQWEELGFQYLRTSCHIEYHHRDGAWDSGGLKTEPVISMSIAATCLHYGQALFEGLKAFRAKDGRALLFRPDENCRRMADTARYLLCPEIPAEMFMDAIQRVVKANIDYLPPYGTGGSMYIRPLLIGTGPTIGVNPSSEYTFIVLVTPVGPYYKGGIKPVEAIVIEEYDRCAPRGSGRFKAAGNYANSFTSSKIAKDKGFPITLFLDPASHQFIDEFGTSNFIGVTADGSYVTPESGSILPSITNKSLQELAVSIGVKVERRPIPFEEIRHFKEVGACGTAVVITPISRIVRGDSAFQYSNECGPVMRNLYDRIRRIQYAEDEAPNGWIQAVE